jgi:predicted Zn-dependent protease
MIKGNAFYYDGLSSVSQNIDLIIDKEKKQLVFTTLLVGEINWPIEDIEINYNSQIINIHFGSKPVQVIKLDDEEFIIEFTQYLKENGKEGWYQRLINLGTKIHVIIAIAFLGTIVLGYIYLLPIIAERAVVLVPEDYDTELGDGFYNQYIEYCEIDSIKTKALNSFAQHLDLENKKNLKFTVVNSETVNAFALPDGNIIVFTGLLDLMENYDELAGLIGHEVAHVNKRHSMKILCRNAAGYLFVSAILSDVNGIMATISDNINSLQSLSYSRGFEQEADEVGLNIMIKNNIKPEGMINLFKRIQNKHDIDIPAILSSHPLTEDRIQTIKNIIKSKNSRYVENKSLRDLFLELKD